MKTLIGFIIALIILNVNTAGAFANDMWSETPDLNNLTTPAFVEPGRLVNKPPKVDMWAETPDLNGNNDAVDFHHEKAVVKYGLADPEMYAEAPNLNKVSPGKSNLPAPEYAVTAEQNKSEMTR
jgi:hypothetical protein